MAELEEYPFEVVRTSEHFHFFFKDYGTGETGYIHSLLKKHFNGGEEIPGLSKTLGIMTNLRLGEEGLQFWSDRISSYVWDEGDIHGKFWFVYDPRGNGAFVQAPAIAREVE